MRVSLLAICVFALSHVLQAQVRFNLFAGPQATTADYTVRSDEQDTKMKGGFQLGAGLKVPFENKLYFSPAVFYSLKGYKVTFNRFLYPPGDDAKDNNTTLHTFEMAALLQYDFSSEPGHVFIKAGPSLDFQLFGKEEFSSRTTNPVVNRSMKFGFADYGHFSANLIGQIGYETAGGVLIFAQYSHGLGNISNTDNGPVIRHRVFGISIGKYLGKKVN